MHPTNIDAILEFSPIFQPNISSSQIIMACMYRLQAYAYSVAQFTLDVCL